MWHRGLTKSDVVPIGMLPEVSDRIAEAGLAHGNKGRSRTAFVWIWHALYILYSLEVGTFLLFLPWLGIWENNYLLYRFPRLRPVVANSFLKGAVLGLGIVNILIGIQEIVRIARYWKSRPSQ